MTLQKLRDNLNLISRKHGNLGFCYGNFPDNQSVPYIAYNSISDNSIHADGICVYKEETVELNLYTHNRDLCLEHELHDMFLSEQVLYNKTFEFDAEQKIHISRYEFITD